MKLLHHTLKYLALALPLIIGIWAALFYYNMLDEVQDSLDDGLENYKMLIIEKAGTDSTTLLKSTFDERNYAIREIPGPEALQIKDQYKDTSMYMLNEEDFEPVRMLSTAFTLKNRYYELKVISSTVEEDDLIEDLLFSLIWLYVVLLISILLINNYVLRQIWKPFYQLLNKIQQFSLDKNPVISPTPSKVKEFGDLNQRIMALTQQAVATYNSQKQFLENASHELQTPLAISINKLELLAENEALQEVQMDTLAQVIGTLERLTRLNKTLLLLSKIENKQFPEVVQVHINALVKTLVADYQDLAINKKVQVQINEQATLQLTMNHDLAMVLISNLLKNALVHNVPGGHVEIKIAATGLSIANSGSAEPLDPDSLFQRFRKKSADKNSIGLGLAIVKAITDAYGLSLFYSFQNRQHQFSIQPAN